MTKNEIKINNNKQTPPKQKEIKTKQTLYHLSHLVTQKLFLKHSLKHKQNKNKTQSLFCVGQLLLDKRPGLECG